MRVISTKEFNLKKIAAPALYDPARMGPQRRPGMMQLFNYLKAQNIRVTMYHGTNLDLYNKAKTKGYLLSASTTGIVADPREENRDSVFLTTSFPYARDYATLNVAELSDKLEPTEENAPQRTPVVVQLSVPIYALSEVRNALFQPPSGTLNEFHLDYKMRKAILGNDEQQNFSPEDILNNIMQVFRESHNSNRSTMPQNEYMSYLGLPLKWQTNLVVLPTEQQQEEPETLGFWDSLKSVKDLWKNRKSRNFQPQFKPIDYSITPTPRTPDELVQQP